MIDRVIEFSARNRFLVIVLAAAAAVWGWNSMTRVGLDAFPDLGDRQVIIQTTWDRSPDLIDSQVTYPIVSALLGTPGVRSVRGQSEYGVSFVYVIFDDHTDPYWARSRTLEYLAALAPKLPPEVKPELGSDATSLGWIFQYVLMDHSGKHSLADLRSYQDWYLDTYLTAVPGVAEVAPVGGFVRQYQVKADPNRLRAYGLSMQRLVEALQHGNRDVGGRVLESGGAEFVVRGLGYARSVEDLGEILVAETEDGTPIRIRDVAQVAIGSEFRRGISDLDGMGDVVSGIVIMRQGENALAVIKRLKSKLAELAPSLPAGVEIIPVYDRSELIHRAIATSRFTIIEVMLTVALVILIFLWHFPSAAVAVITIPLAVLISFIPFSRLGLSANIMSLGGIAIAIGALVDASIVVVEQIRRELEEWQRTGRRAGPEQVILAAIKKIARPAFFALLIIALSFLPILALEGEEGRLFKPLAFAKTFAMMIAAVLAITLSPTLCLWFTRTKRLSFRPDWLCRLTNAVTVGTIHQESRHPITGRLIRWYEPVVNWALDHKRAVAVILLLLTLATIPAGLTIKREYMPPFDEGALLYMPTTTPGISATEAQRLLQATDQALMKFPEVARVLGKAGRAETATDPAPLSMFETLIVLQPKSEWRSRPTWYSSWAPDWLKPALRLVTSDRLTREELIAEMDEALKLPGLANAWTMPVRARLDMLTTGIRTPLGVKVAGSDVKQAQQIGEQIAAVLAKVSGTRSVFAERAGDGYYLDIDWNRPALARHGLSIDDAQAAVQYAIGGENVMSMILGRERYPVNVRYLQDYRADAEALGRVLVSTEDGRRHIPIADLAKIQTTTAPASLRNENGLPTSYITLDLGRTDFGNFIAEANRVIQQEVALPAGCSYSWSGQYEAMARNKERLVQIIPLTLLLILALLYLNTRSWTKTLMVMLAVPFSLLGAVWLVWLLDYNLSVAVWVGLIALLGVDAETGVFMLVYLDHAFDQARRTGRMTSEADLRAAVVEGAARRLRPKLMTVAAMIIGLLPIMWSAGTGSDIMKRIAAPLLGGICTSFLLELLVYPVLYYAWKSRTELKR